MFISRKELSALKRAAIIRVWSEDGLPHYVPLKDAVIALADAAGVKLQWKEGSEGRIVAAKRK